MWTVPEFSSPSTIAGTWSRLLLPMHWGWDISCLATASCILLHISLDIHTRRLEPEAAHNSASVPQVWQRACVDEKQVHAPHQPHPHPSITLFSKSKHKYYFKTFAHNCVQFGDMDIDVVNKVGVTRLTRSWVTMICDWFGLCVCVCVCVYFFFPIPVL